MRQRSGELAGGESMTLAAFARVLGEAKRASRWSYKALGRELDRPATTLHGWITGSHLPYPRDNDDFVRLLALLGIDDTSAMLHAVAQLRGERGSPVRRNPYRGLDPFTAEDAELFFGRSDDTDAVVGQIMARLAGGGMAPPLIVIGRSGVGKSSLLQAGVLANLRSAHSVDADYVDAADLTDNLTDDLAASAARVVIVDQFEYLLHIDDPDRLGDSLAALQRVSGHGVVVVIGLRADYFEQASAVEFLMDGFRAGPFVLGPLTAEQLSACITAPAERFGRSLEPQLLSQLLLDFRLHADSAVASSPLPLLSHILYRLAASGRPQLTLADYESIGGLQGALERSAESAFTELETIHPGATRAVLCRMVELGAGGRPTRRPVRLDALGSLLPGSALPSEDVDAVITAFTERRLVTVDIESTTISHEAMIGAWPRLAGWIDDTRTALATARRVGNARSVWEEAHRDDSMLLSGPALDDAITVTDDAIAALHLDEADQAFLDLSRRQQERRQAESEAAASRQLAARATALGESERSVAAQVAAAAYRIAPTVEARSALISAASSALGPRFESSPGATGLARFGYGLANSSRNVVKLYQRSQHGLVLKREVAAPCDGDIVDFSISSDGRTILFAMSTGCSGLIELDTGRLVPLAAVGTPNGASGTTALTSDGAVALVGGSGDRITVWRRTDDGAWDRAGQIAALAGELSAVTLAMAVSSSGRRLATAGQDGTVALWDLDDFDRPLWRNVDLLGDPASAIAIDGEGSLVVAGHHGGEVRAWDLSDPLAPIEFEQTAGRSATWINGISFDPTGRIVAVAGSDGQVRFWQVDGWRALDRRLRHPAVVTAVAQLDGSGLATTGEDGVLRTWGDHQAQPLDAPPSWAMVTDRSGSVAVSANRGGAYSWRVGDHDGMIASEVYRSEVPGEVLAGSGALSGDGRTLYLGTRTGTVLCVDPATARVTARLGGAGELIEHVAAASDEAGTVVAAAVRDGICPIWNHAPISEPTLIGTVEVPSPALGVAIDRGGQLIVVTSGAGDIALAAIEVDGSVRVVDRVLPEGTGGTLCAAFHPTLAVFAVGSVDRSATIWSFDDERLTQQQVLPGPSGNVMTVAFSPSGHRLAAGATDGSVWIWRLQSSDAFELETIVATETTGIYALAFASDDQLFTAGPASTPQRWNLDPEVILRTLHQRVGDAVSPPLLRP